MHGRIGNSSEMHRKSTFSPSHDKTALQRRSAENQPCRILL